MKIYRRILGEFQTNCYIVASEKGNAVVIDAGDEPQRIEEVLREQNLTLKLLLLTHGHFDHILAVKALQKKYQVPVAVCKEDAFMLEEPKSVYTGYYMPVVDALCIDADKKFQDGDVLTVDELQFRVIATPGHTPGSCVFACEDILFTGDTLFQGSIGRTDLYGGDHALLIRSLQKLKELPGEYRILSGHGEQTTLSREKLENPFMLSEESYDAVY